MHGTSRYANTGAPKTTFQCKTSGGNDFALLNNSIFSEIKSRILPVFILNACSLYVLTAKERIFFLFMSEHPDTNPQTPDIWIKWLSVTAVGIALFGLSMALLPAFTAKVFSSLIYFRPDFIESEFTPESLKYIQLAHAVLGSVMVGWGMLLLMLAIGPLRKGNRDILKYFTVSIFSWALPDTLFSLLSGFWPNALLNLALALLLLIPIVAIKMNNRFN